MNNWSAFAAIVFSLPVLLGAVSGSVVPTAQARDEVGFPLHSLPVALSDGESTLPADGGPTERSSLQTQADSPLRVGTILPLTGVLEVFGVSMRRAADLAAAEINAQGGQPLTLIHEDSQTDAGSAVVAARKLIDTDGVEAIIGAAASSVSAPVAEGVTIPDEIVQVSPSSTSPRFTTLEPAEPGWFWRTIPSDALQGKAAALYAYETRGWRHVAILARGDSYGFGLASSFQDTFESLGGEIPVRVDYNPTAPSYTAELEAIFASSPEAIWFVAFPGEGQLIMQEWWANSAWRGPSWLWAESLRFQGFVDDLQASGIDVRGVEGTSPILGGPHFEGFRQRYVNATGAEPRPFDAHTYDALYLLALAAAAAQSGGSVGIRDHLLAVSRTPGTPVGPGPSGFEEAVEILEAGGEVNYQGAAGLVDFDKVGNVGGPYDIWRINDAFEIEGLDVVPEGAVWPVPEDTTSPTLTIASPASDAIFATPEVSVTWTAEDLESGLDRVEVRLDGGAPAVFGGQVSSHAYSNVQDGFHTVRVSAFDLTGNTASAAVDFTVDGTPPALTLTSPAPSALLNTSTVQVTWSGSDATSGLARFELVLDQASAPIILPPSASAHSLSNVLDGSHIVEVTAYDLAGNSGSSNVGYTVDTTPPTLAIRSPSEGAVLSSGTVVLEWTATDATSGLTHFEVRLDAGSPFQITEQTFTFDGLRDGIHSASITAFDAAGNKGVESVSFQVRTTPLGPSGAPDALTLAVLAAASIAGGAILLFLFLRRRRAT